jgi:hypothetical protein
MFFRFFTRLMPMLALVGGTMFALVGNASSAMADCTAPYCYGAIAAALWNDASGSAHVATGISWNYSSLGQAQTNAIGQCQSRGGPNCLTVGAFGMGGCGYIATGNSQNGVKYGVGGSPQEALNMCSAGGYSCGAPIGGCTAGR